jgi:hypothetical protein
MTSTRENSRMNNDDDKEDVVFPVFWIQIRMFSGLLDPDTLVRAEVKCADPDPSPFKK